MAATPPLPAGLPPSFDDEAEQTKYLEEATQAVKLQAFHMKRAMDEKEPNIKHALKYAADMLRELRTALLTPKNYYELYMRVFDEMRALEQFFSEMHRGGTKMEELYQMVQSCGNVLPRLYLLITVGSVYIESREAAAKDIFGIYALYGQGLV